MEAIEGTPSQWQQGIIVKLQKIPFKVKLFKLVATNEHIDWLSSNDLDSPPTAQLAQEAND